MSVRMTARRLGLFVHGSESEKVMDLLTRCLWGHEYTHYAQAYRDRIALSQAQATFELSNGFSKDQQLSISAFCSIATSRETL